MTAEIQNIFFYRRTCIAFDLQNVYMNTTCNHLRLFKGIERFRKHLILLILTKIVRFAMDDIW